MELRRALLLFAIVLALAAVVTAITGGRDDRDDDNAPPVSRAESLPTARAGPASGPLTVPIDADRAATTYNADAGQAITLSVSSEEAGEVTLPDLGLTSAVEPGDPALFDVYGSPGRHAIEFAAAGDGQTRRVGVLAVRER